MKSFSPATMAESFTKYSKYILSGIDMRNFKVKDLKDAFLRMQFIIEKQTGLKVDLFTCWDSFSKRVESYKDDDDLTRAQTRDKIYNLAESYTYNLSKTALSISISDSLKGKICVWGPTESVHPRENHLENDGELYNCEKGIDGVRPGELINCKCYIIVLTDNEVQSYIDSGAEIN